MIQPSVSDVATLSYCFWFFFKKNTHLTYLVSGVIFTSFQEQVLKQQEKCIIL